MPTITVPDDTYRRFACRATELGTTVDALVAPALERVTQGSTPNGTPATPPGDLPYDEWKKRFEDILASPQSRADR